MTYFIKLQMNEFFELHLICNLVENGFPESWIVGAKRGPTGHQKLSVSCGSHHMMHNVTMGSQLLRKITNMDFPKLLHP